MKIFLVHREDSVSFSSEESLCEKEHFALHLFVEIHGILGEEISVNDVYYSRAVFHSRRESYVECGKRGVENNEIEVFLIENFSYRLTAFAVLL